MVLAPQCLRPNAVACREAFRRRRGGGPSYKSDKEISAAHKGAISTRRGKPRQRSLFAATPPNMVARKHWLGLYLTNADDVSLLFSRWRAASSPCSQRNLRRRYRGAGHGPRISARRGSNDARDRDLERAAPGWRRRSASDALQSRLIRRSSRVPRLRGLIPSRPPYNHMLPLRAGHDIPIDSIRE